MLDPDSANSSVTPQHPPSVQELKQALDYHSLILSKPTAQQGVISCQNCLATKLKQLTPLPLYRIFIRLKSVGKQKKLGQMIAKVQKYNQFAWQQLGESRANHVSRFTLRKYQLVCEQSQLWLDLLEGRGDSLVTCCRAEVVDCLVACSQASSLSEFELKNRQYLLANERLKQAVVHEYELKRVIHNDQLTEADHTELKTFEKVLVDESSALEAFHLYGH